MVARQVTTKAELRTEWAKMVLALQAQVPLKVLNWLEGGVVSHKTHPLLIIMTALIVSLASASILNFVGQAYKHHAGWSAYVGGIGLAALVPVTVFFAVYADITKAQRAGVWLIAVVFVTMSATIQFPVYADGAPLTWAYLGSAEFNLEAFAFGAGNPIAECLLAVMEGIYLNSMRRKEAIDSEAEDQRAADEREQTRLDKEAEEKRAREVKAAEDQRIREHQEFQLTQRLKEAAAQNKLDIDRLKVEAKLSNRVSNSVSNLSKLDSASNDITPVDEISRLTKAQALDTLLAAFRQNPHLSRREAGRLIGRTKDTVGNYLKELEGAGLVNVNGHVDVL